MFPDAANALWLHATLEWLGIAVGVLLYRRQGARANLAHGGFTRGDNFAVVAGLLAGAALGNKLAFLAERPDVLLAILQGAWVMPGQSIVGGLLGGLIGVETAKALTKQQRSTGDAMVWPLAIGISVGRMGCFIAGLHDDTYGNATTLPWAVDFGDGVARHPTQLYDMLAVLLIAWAVHGRFPAASGLAFKLFLAGYLAWRLVIDCIKPIPHAYALGLSGIQWVCALALLVYMPIVIRQWRTR